MTTRTFTIVSGVLCLVLLTLPATEISPARPPAEWSVPSADEVRLLTDLSNWVHGDPGGDLAEAMREQADVFDLFTHYNARESRLAFVETLPHGSAIRAAAAKHGVDSLLIAAVVSVESGFRTSAVSSRGALGLTQLMPDTAAMLCVADPFDPGENVDAGARYLGVLLRQFDGDLELALAAYNAGPGNVLRFGGVPPFPETRDYVQKVLARYVQYHRELWWEADEAEVLVLG